MKSKCDLLASYFVSQTLGNRFEVDGRLKGDLSVAEISCDIPNSACTIPLSSPGFALVFFDANDELTTLGQTTETFSTTTNTKTANTATIDPAVLATSNGHSGKDRSVLGSTSKGSVSASRRVKGDIFGACIIGALFVVSIIACPL